MPYGLPYTGARDRLVVLSDQNRTPPAGGCGADSFLAGGLAVLGPTGNAESLESGPVAEGAAVSAAGESAAGVDATGFSCAGALLGDVTAGAFVSTTNRSCTSQSRLNCSRTKAGIAG